MFQNSNNFKVNFIKIQLQIVTTQLILCIFTTLKHKPMKLAQMFVLFLLITSFGTFAQEDEPKTVLSKSETIELIGSHVISFGSAEKEVLGVEQTGDNNQLTSVQQLTQPDNYVFQTAQTGDNNVGYTFQAGTNHELILNQNGNNNEANLWSYGLSTQNFVQQEGSNNFVNSYIENTSMDSRSATSIQLGDNNKINLQLPDNSPLSALKGIVVLQTGPGNSADIMLNHYGSPFLKVEQTGGAAISITHSAFNFPTR